MSAPKKPRLTSVELIVMWMSPVCALAAILCAVYGYFEWAYLAAFGAVWFEVSL